jgi:hypothetical protein
MRPFVRRIRRMAGGLVLAMPLGGLAAQGAPAVPWQAMLAISPRLQGDAPAFALPALDIAFTPESPGDAELLVHRGDAVEARVVLRPTQRVGNVQRYSPRSPFARLEAVEGERRVEVRLADRVVGAMTVTFRRAASADGFGTGGSWTATGPWADHGYFTRPSDPADQQRVRFTYWASTVELGGAAKAMQELVIKRGSTVLAKGAPREVSSADWLRKEQDLRTPGGDVVLASHLATAGPLVVELHSGGRVLKRWETRVTDGWIAPHALSAMPPTDATHFLSPRALGSGGGSMAPFLYSWVTR